MKKTLLAIWFAALSIVSLSSCNSNSRVITPLKTETTHNGSFSGLVDVTRKANETFDLESGRTYALGFINPDSNVTYLIDSNSTGNILALSNGGKSNGYSISFNNLLKDHDSCFFDYLEETVTNTTYYYFSNQKGKYIYCDGATSTGGLTSTKTSIDGISQQESYCHLFASYAGQMGLGYLCLSNPGASNQTMSCQYNAPASTLFSIAIYEIYEYDAIDLESDVRIATDSELNQFSTLQAKYQALPNIERQKFCLSDTASTYGKMYKGTGNPFASKTPELEYDAANNCLTNATYLEDYIIIGTYDGFNVNYYNSDIYGGEDFNYEITTDGTIAIDPEWGTSVQVYIFGKEYDAEISDYDYSSAIQTVLFETRVDNPDVPSGISFSKITDTSFVASSDGGVEFSLNGSSWGSGSFKNLTPGTKYTVSARFAESEEYFASKSISATVTTLTELEYLKIKTQEELDKIYATYTKYGYAAIDNLYTSFTNQITNSETVEALKALALTFEPTFSFVVVREDYLIKIQGAAVESDGYFTTDLINEYYDKLSAYEYGNQSEDDIKTLYRELETKINLSHYKQKLLANYCSFFNGILSGYTGDTSTLWSTFDSGYTLIINAELTKDDIGNAYDTAVKNLRNV